MSETTAKRGLLANAFSKPGWDSRIKSANTTKKELWLGYIVGPFGMLMGQSIVNSYFNQYLTDVMGFTVSKAAWIATFMVLFPIVSKLIDAVTNVVMGRIIDSTVCRQGKVRPWMLISIPFVVISIMLMFWIPVAGTLAQAIWVVVSYNLYYSVSYTLWNMSKELSAALSTSNVNQRKNNAMGLTIVANVGTGLVSILFPTILTKICAAVNGDNATGYFIAMSTFALIAVPLTFVQYFYTRERVTEERRGQSAAADTSSNTVTLNKPEAGLWQQFKVCVKNKYWLIFIIIMLVFNIFANMRNISLVYYSGWVVNGNAYGTYATIQAKFQMIAFSPMGPGIILLLPLVKKWGRRRCCWVGATLTIVGSALAFFYAGNSMMIYMGTALSAIGCLFFNYTMPSYLGDIIDHVEWKTHVRCDGISGSFYSAVMMVAVGIAQGIFNLGLMITGYTQPEAIGTSADGVTLYADQTAAATGWINFSYQGTYIILGILIFIIFLFFFDIEKHMPTVTKELQDRRKAECAALGIEYISAQEQERREIEEQEAKAEEIRISELKEKCEKKGLDFEAENQKVLDKRAAAAAKKAAKAEKAAAKAEKKNKK